MKLPREEWYPQAQSLLIGGRTSARGDHACGDPGSLMLKREGARVSAYCFRCGGTGQHVENEVPAEKLARMRAAEAVEDKLRWSAELPEPTAYKPESWPEKDRLWFYKMGLSPTRIRELGLYWSEPMQRVVLPIHRDGEAVYWTARSQLRSPKWTGPRVPKRGLAAKYGEGRGTSVVLTEDPLSAYKVGLVCEAWSLLGTKLHSRHISELIARGRPVVVWLDDDKGRRNGRNPGQEAARQIIKELRAVGLEARNMTSDMDPKYYNRYQLERMLYEHV